MSYKQGLALAATMALLGCGSADAGPSGGSGGGGGATASSSSVATQAASTTGAGGAAASTSGAGGAGTGGGAASTSAATGGGSPCGGGPLEIDLHQATLFANPPDLADWPVTTTLTEVDFGNDGLHVEFSKLDGPNRWPDVIPPGWDGPLEYTLGMAECIDGQWTASAVIEFWYGLYASGGNVATNDQIATNWYYDPARWGTLAGRQPATGETIGIFVAAGNLRNVTTDDTAQSPVMERSNVVLVPMPDANGAMHSF